MPFKSLLVLSSLSLFGIAHAAPAPKGPPYGLPSLERQDFNRLAGLAGLPLFWRADAFNPGVLDANELALLGTQPPAQPAKLATYVGIDGKDGATFTRDFEKAYRQLVELRRREAVKNELDQGRPTLVETDLTGMAKEDRAIIASLTKAAQQVDALYQLQIGSAGMLAKVPKDDLASRALLVRNQQPWCQAPKTQDDPFCNALPTFPKPVQAAWPKDMKIDASFCEAIAKEPNGKELTAPFTVVRAIKKGGFSAVQYSVAYKGPMRAIATTLKATAKLVKGKDEAAFKAYLLAAATAFENNDWPAADEAWTAMSADNSKYYLRIAPDETYWDACGVKAGFHMSFALVDRTALEWKAKLTGVRSDLEATLAGLIGAPYTARAVAFDLPEFINIVINGGDSRDGLGATVGQSLPNFGAVAAESRGRTVAMVNIYTDPDTLGDFAKRDRSLFSDASFAFSTEDPASERLGTVMHEATHNLGPNGSYLVDGKRGEEIFGGPTDAILEELKAQTGALYFQAFLLGKGFVTAQDVKQGYVGSIAWGFGHIARGMFTGEGQPKTYSQLSAIQVGELMAAGAIRWVEGDPGMADPGRFDLDFDKLPGAIEALMRMVSRIKATGDIQGAKDLIARHTTPEGLAKIHADLITERALRYPRASFVYGLRE